MSLKLGSNTGLMLLADSTGGSQAEIHTSCFFPSLLKHIFLVIRIPMTLSPNYLIYSKFIISSCQVYQKRKREVDKISLTKILIYLPLFIREKKSDPNLSKTWQTSLLYVFFYFWIFLHQWPISLAPDLPLIFSLLSMNITSFSYTEKLSSFSFIFKPTTPIFLPLFHYQTP